MHNLEVKEQKLLVVVIVAVIELVVIVPLFQIYPCKFFQKIQVLHICKVLQEYGILGGKISDINSVSHWKFLQPVGIF